MFSGLRSQMLASDWTIPEQNIESYQLQFCWTPTSETWNSGKQNTQIPLKIISDGKKEDADGICTDAVDYTH